MMSVELDEIILVRHVGDSDTGKKTRLINSISNLSIIEKTEYSRAEDPKLRGGHP